MVLVTGLTKHIYLYMYIYLYFVCIHVYNVYKPVQTYIVWVWIHILIPIPIYMTYTYRTDGARGCWDKLGLGLEQDQPADSASMTCGHFMISGYGNGLQVEIKAREGWGLYRQGCPKGTVLTRGLVLSGYLDLFRVNIWAIPKVKVQVMRTKG